MEKVFEMFYRGSILSKGSGLGLYIVKEIVEKLMGKIELKSTVTPQEQSGTIIIVEIPNNIE